MLLYTSLPRVHDIKWKRMFEQSNIFIISELLSFGSRLLESKRIQSTHILVSKSSWNCKKLGKKIIIIPISPLETASSTLFNLQLILVEKKKCQDKRGEMEKKRCEDSDLACSHIMRSILDHTRKAVSLRLMFNYTKRPPEPFTSKTLTRFPWRPGCLKASYSWHDPHWVWLSPAKWSFWPNCIKCMCGTGSTGRTAWDLEG